MPATTAFLQDNVKLYENLVQETESSSNPAIKAFIDARASGGVPDFSGRHRSLIDHSTPGTRADVELKLRTLS
jgi:hypothetical protein